MMNHIDFASNDVNASIEKQIISSNNIFYFSITELRSIYFLSLNDINKFNLEISKIMDNHNASTQIKQRAKLYREIPKSL